MKIEILSQNDRTTQNTSFTTKKVTIMLLKLVVLQWYENLLSPINNKTIEENLVSPVKIIELLVPANVFNRIESIFFFIRRSLSDIYIKKIKIF